MNSLSDIKAKDPIYHFVIWKHVTFIFYVRTTFKQIKIAYRSTTGGLTANLTLS